MLFADAQHPERVRKGLWPARLLFGSLLLLVLLTMAAPLVSGDLWWHLRLGEWMLDQRAILDHEPFSHTLAGADSSHWTPQEWGSELCFALVERLGGILGLKLLGAALALVVLVLVQRIASRSLPPLWSVAATALFAALYALKWELRPHLLSAPLFLVLVSMLFARERSPAWMPGKREWLGLYLLGLAWVLLHAEALFAALLPAAGLGGALLASLLEGAPWKRVGDWALASAAGLAGVCSSPLGIEPLRYAIAGRSVPVKYIEEWFPPWILPGDARFAPLSTALFALISLLLLAGSVWLCWHALWRVRQRERRTDAPTLERLAFLALCLLLAWSARRYAWLLWFPALELLLLLVRRRTSWSAARLAPGLLAAGLVLLLARVHYAANALDNLRRGSFSAPADARYLPRHAADFMSEAQLCGNLFHPYEWGGYLLWALPATRPFLYGETVLFAAVIEERWYAEHDAERARETFARRAVRLIVMPRVVARGQGFEAWRPPDAAAGGESWVRAFADQLAVVWVRGDDAENLERVQQFYARQGVDFDPALGFAEAAALRVHPAWLEERELLPEPLAAALAELYAPGPLADPASVELRAALYEEFRLSRSARWEREHPLGVQQD